VAKTVDFVEVIARSQVVDYEDGASGRT
jgi:hypothetical protein